MRLRVTVIVIALLASACGGSNLPDVDVFAVAEPSVEVPVEPVLFDGAWEETAEVIRRNAEAGRPTVLNLFASWCAPCRAEAPVLREAIASHPEIGWLGVAHLDLKPKSEGFLAQYDLDELAFPTLWDPTGEIAAAIGSRGLPTTAFFDHEGRLVALHLGILTEPLLAQRVADLAAAAGIEG